MTELFVHIARHQDKELASRMRSDNLGWMLSGEYVLRSRRTLSEDIATVGHVLIDPLTARMDAGLGWSVAKDGGLKPAYDELWATYLRGLPKQSKFEAWRARSAEERAVFAGNVLDHAARVLDPARQYGLELFDLGELPPAARRLGPDAVLAPYVLVRSPVDLSEQVELWRAAGRSFAGLPVERVLLLSPDYLARHDPSPTVVSLAEGSRVWIGVPDLRERILTRSSVTVVPRLRRLTRRLTEQVPVGIIGAGFFAATLLVEGASAVCFTTHMEGLHSRKRGGAPVPYSYVPAVHGWEHYERVRRVVSECTTPAEMGHWFCPESRCARLFEQLGPRDFATAMFETRRTTEGEVPTVEAADAQLDHAVRARVMEIDEIQSSTRIDLARRLSAEAARSPFRRPAEVLLRWAALLQIEERAAA